MESARRYRLVRTIGTGGMAQVFAAVAEGHGIERRVAIKRMLGSLADDAARRMFLDEARIASQLHHGNIAAVLDYGVVESDPFMVLELVDGLDAGKASRLGAKHGQRMPAGVALHVAAEVAHALAYVHGRTDDAGISLGIVHRDVSPGNVLCSWEGDVKLTDFGIALAFSRSEKTAAGIVKGKPDYMAPEQAMGRSATGAADVFALGNTLHSLLTGAPARGTDELPWWLAQVPRVPLSKELEPELAELLEAMLAVDVERRPAASVVAERCERLAKARIQGAGRSALRGWLASLQAQVEPDAALDRLFDVAIEPVALEAPTQPGEAARFEVVRREAPAPREPTSATVPVRRSTRPRAAGSRRWGLALGVAIPLVALGLGLAWSMRGEAEPHDPRGAPEGASLTPTSTIGDRESTPRTPEATSTPVAIEGERSRGPDDPTTVDPAPPPTTEATADRAVEEDEARPRAHESDRSRPARNETPAVVASDPPTAPTEASPGGYLRIGGAALAGAALEIDGTRAGYLPALRRLPSGAHHVVVRHVEDGTTMLERDVVIAPEHTQSSPLVVR